MTDVLRPRPEPPVSSAALSADGFAGLPERYQPTNLPRCAVCGSQIVDVHSCPSGVSQTSAILPGAIHLTPWGTWEWRPW